jgi:hypothetical protein
MATKPLLQSLQRELGGGEVKFLAVLPDDALVKLESDIRSARQRQRRTLDEAIDKGLRMAPMLLRGPLKKILFP